MHFLKKINILRLLKNAKTKKIDVDRKKIGIKKKTLTLEFFLSSNYIYL